LQFTLVVLHPLAAVQPGRLHLSPGHEIVVNKHPVAGTQLSVVHSELSLQVLFANTQPVLTLQLSSVHRLLSLQVIGVFWQPTLGGTSTAHASNVQALLSLHSAISAAVQQD
jgi:hypothetical protein